MIRDVLVLVGTRPEAIKMAPLVHALKRRGTGRTILCSTGQHRQMLDQVLEIFALKPDVDLALMKPRQDPAELTANILLAVGGVLRQERPQAVLVHGDTTTCLAGTLAAFYERIPVGHVEAGLRTHNLEAPWPEEMNRRLTDPLCRWCFAPTTRARQNLLAERIPEERILLTGNTVVDALGFALQEINRQAPSLPGLDPAALKGRRVIMVTAHRREHFGARFEDLCQGLVGIVQRHPDVCLVYPVHLNPNVQEPVRRLLSGHPRIHLVEPLSYLPFVWLMRQSTLILTDSGGIQEEAPSLGVPVLVMRDATERPEAVEAGAARTVGTDPERILAEATRLLTDPVAYQSMARAGNPFGDGRAAERIVAALGAS